MLDSLHTHKTSSVITDNRFGKSKSYEQRCSLSITTAESRCSTRSTNGLYPLRVCIIEYKYHFTLEHNLYATAPRVSQANSMDEGGQQPVTTAAIGIVSNVVLDVLRDVGHTSGPVLSFSLNPVSSV